MELFFSWMAEGFDLPILDWMARTLQNPVLDWLMPKITLLGDGGIFWIVLAVAFLCVPETRKIGLTMGIALIVGLVMSNTILKPLMARIRPFDYQRLHFGKEISLLITAPGGYSFPSGHTMSAFVSAVSVTRYNRKWGIPALILAALVAFSRLYLYVHYPTDVLCSMLLGAGIAFFAAWLVEKGYILWSKKAKQKPAV